ncbi:MAG: hydroxyacid dehydrogenase [Spirochaetes bacterium]|nr:hydroxyacid dehydrogenase [Spirochaetota bacterium]
MSTHVNTVLLPEPIEEEARKLLEQRGVRILQSPDTKLETVKPLLEQADAVVLRTGIRMSVELIECGNRLTAISRTGAGFDNVDIEAATRMGVIVSSSVGANTYTVAEHTLALILALAKQLPALDRETRAGNFRIRYSYLPRDLRGAVIGAVGFGRIGREVAHACATVLGMKVLAFDAYMPEAAKERDRSWVRFCELEELLEKADVVAIHVPLTAETQGLIDSRRIALMKKGALIINTSRGGIINEEALAYALASGKLGGAGIDVFSQEPPPATNPLLAAPSAILTPHAAALTGECVQRMAVLAAQRVLDQFDGLIPENVANPEVLKNARWSSLRKRKKQEP